MTYTVLHTVLKSDKHSPPFKKSASNCQFLFCDNQCNKLKSTNGAPVKEASCEMKSIFLCGLVNDAPIKNLQNYKEGKEKQLETKLNIKPKFLIFQYEIIF